MKDTTDAYGGYTAVGTHFMNSRSTFLKEEIVMSQGFNELITGVLKAKGWTIVDSTAIALKSYETAVGPKEAQAYLSRGDGYNVTLYGMYYSEGRNILEPRGQLIPVDADEATVLAAAERFAASVDTEVANSYAGRLLRR